jgi:hypothetical protein
MSRMKKLLDWIKAHPRLTAWIVLGLGMDAMVAYEARDVGLQPLQWVALLVATALVAGLCVWIIGWDDAEAEADKAPENKAAEPASAPAKPEERNAGK